QPAVRPRCLRPFPTRRSSDLKLLAPLDAGVAQIRGHLIRHAEGRHDALLDVGQGLLAVCPINSFVPLLVHGAAREAIVILAVAEIGSAHVWTPVTFRSRMPSS